ncbi:MCRI2 protein, partial [Pomatorhinus ruficollis]|nr:MCRI2 protein [Pomatorhinus ruficollis]
SPAQKLVFNRVNGKRPPLLLQQISAPEECYTLAHEENVRFVYEGEGRGIFCDSMVIVSGVQKGAPTALLPLQLLPSPLPSFSDFVPIDLEEWWAQQFLAKIENCS